jgi:hypothetical protein
LFRLVVCFQSLILNNCDSHQNFADQKQEDMIQFLLKAGAKRLPDRWGNVPQ